MPIEIEVNMKVPTLTVRLPNEPVKRIDNTFVRFGRRITTPALPKPGDSLALTAGANNLEFGCTVTRTEWHEEKELFVVSCTFSKRTLPFELYTALFDDPDWTTKQIGSGT